MEQGNHRDRILGAVHRVADELGYIIYEASVLIKGVNSKVIVKIDHLKGISHQDCEVFSRGLGHRIDDERILANYSLEVSSPGIDRKLRTEDEFSRFRGAPVRVTWDDGDVSRTIKGVLMEAERGRVAIESEGRLFSIDFERITSANLSY